MLARLALLFVLIPILELALLIQIGQWVGLPWTLGLVVLTGVMGATLARAEGLRTLSAFQREMAQGRLPGQPIMDGLSVLVGGAFLLTPGLLTDVVGFALLIPISRRWLQARTRRWLKKRVEAGQLQVGVWPPGPGAVPPEGPSRIEELDPRHELGRDEAGR